MTIKRFEPNAKPSSNGFTYARMSELANGGYVKHEDFEQQQQEIAELKAKIELMRGISLSSNYDDIYHLIDALADIINKTPKQCLASVKADAVDGFIKSYINVKAMDGHGDEAEEVSNYASSYNKLREQK